MAFLRKLFSKISVFLEMIKFEHSVFALPFAYLGLFLAENGWPRWFLLFWVTVAMVSFRTLAMSLNRLIDRSIDALNPRTQNRALPTGKIKALFVWGCALGSLLVFEWSAYRLNSLCFRLSWIPVALAVCYPWTKRFTWFSHWVLGIILGIAPCGAWIASKAALDVIPCFLTIGVTFWVAGFDIIYALQDLEFDRQFKLYSFPARFGVSASLVMTEIMHGGAVIAWLVAGWLAGLGLVFLVGILGVTACLVRENWLIRTGGMSKIQEAFFIMNGIASIGLFVAVWLDLIVRGTRP
ncbi:MAG: putative 4-hydroxybenzoate polyprenyltransferase [Candidatus Omnitrophica bacterium]|nr:putative 4-hydroxybenzoate polyprenyltransferase [Candidatus Omnitrophota bacterium]MDD5672434.1 putative 4-hydroxybenzoate polyprenyltransferase [Candidatus Omnitrophota bacterium]